MTRSEFIAQNRVRMAGLAIMGVTSRIADGALGQASRALEIVPNVDLWLGELYDMILPPTPPAPYQSPTLAQARDGLNGVAYRDDRQVKRAHIEIYASRDPRIEIEIGPMDWTPLSAIPKR